MALIEIKQQPSRLEQRIFGMLFAAFFGLIGGLVLWKGGSLTRAAILWSIGATVALVYYAVPGLRWPIYIGWMRASYPIGWVVSHVMLALIFYGVMTPVGLIMRLLGQDPMQRRLHTGERSYWTKLAPPASKARYFRQS